MKNTKDEAKNELEVKITFTGEPGSGKNMLLQIAEKAIRKAGHEVKLAHEYLPKSMKVIVNQEARVDRKRKQ